MTVIQGVVCAAKEEPQFRVAANVLLADADGNLALLRPMSEESPWRLPGGPADKNEAPRAAAWRIGRDQLGVHMQVGALLGVHWQAGDDAAGTPPWVVFTYEARVEQPDIERISPPNGMWLSWSEPRALAADGAMTEGDAAAVLAALDSAGSGRTAYLEDGQRLA